MRFGISIPQSYADGEFDPASFRSYFDLVEGLGYEGAWAHEGMLTASPTLSAIETMTYAAACTTRIRLGCSVLVSTLHSPVHLAQRIATLDQLSGGRIDVGIGTGGGQRPFGAFGMTADRYVTRFTEGLTVMKALWTQPRVTFAGEFCQLKDAAAEPKPAQKPHPPVWFGAASEAALRRAARLGDGFFGAGSASVDVFAGQVRVLREALAAEGRDPSGFPIAKRIYIVVDSDGARAREVATGVMLQRHPGRAVPPIGPTILAGTPEECAEGARASAAAGADLILFDALTESAEQAERIATEVVPLVRQSPDLTATR
jgi:probable F420-dependent oxidoreductase